MVRKPQTIRPHRHTRRVYCAGPLFNRAERDEMVAIAAVLARAGFEPFLPHADGMEFALVRPLLIAQGHEPEAVGQIVHAAVFALDVYQVAVGCGTLVFNMNGRVPDEGGVAELTIATMLGKPVVLYKEDVRTATAGRDNPLIVGQAGFTTVGELDDIAPELAARIAELNPDPAAEVGCPPALRRAIAAGERLWSELVQLGPRPAPEPVAEIVLELFGSQFETIEE